MGYVVRTVWGSIIVSFILQGDSIEHDATLAVTAHAIPAEGALRTVLESEQPSLVNSPLLINIEERPCGDAHQICTGITIQRPSSESSIITQIQQTSQPGVSVASEASTDVVVPVVAPREQTPMLSIPSYLRSWLSREIWIPALLNGIVQYYGMTQIQKWDSKLLVRLGLACIAVPAWYTVMRTQRMEHGIPSLVTGFLLSQLALSSD